MRPLIRAPFQCQRLNVIPSLPFPSQQPIPLALPLADSQTQTQVLNMTKALSGDFDIAGFFYTARRFC